ncbi:hypothetical protein [Chryseolinea lacunae]|uniref:Uncharacterized protein n=1 Tax=Chryseolinea lacunae TaxID=2801331 RepID=A0ABS1KPQ2_9BACT|nr:hypothetical protein [Chryseolinea lacunae]MBL0741453.1 hypothetical protein [Chryseolinea lacunae]
MQTLPDWGASLRTPAYRPQPRAAKSRYPLAKDHADSNFSEARFRWDFHAFAQPWQRSSFTFQNLKNMKNLKYAFLIVLAILAASCTEEEIGPLHEDDPIAIPPPPKPK